MSKIVYRHKICDDLIQANMLDCACIGCGGNCVFFDMDVPAERRDISDAGNRAWLRNNLNIRNKDHELLEFTMQKILEHS